jgi:hypothetical protein
MDEMKLNQMKSFSSAWRLKTRLTGVLNHGREAIAYFDMHQWSHDSNLIMNVLLQVLVRIECVPDILYIKMDNCWRENKNQHIFAFLGVLVGLEIFKKV